MENNTNPDDRCDDCGAVYKPNDTSVDDYRCAHCVSMGLS